MKNWIVRYNLEVAPKTFYPKEVSVQANDKRLAKMLAKRIIAENTDMEQVERIIITEIIPC